MELDKLVPEKLGVSPAVLDAVIFCHQDESLWPMSAPADLKKKFDEIFEAQKYAKVIENLKLLKKKKGEELRILKVQEAQDKENKERADRVDRELSKLTREIQEARDKCNELLDQIEHEDVRIKQKWEQANSFLRIVNELQTKQEKLEYKKDAIAELRERIEESTGSDEYLRDALNQYEQTVERMNTDRDQKVAQFGTLQTELKTARVKHTAKAEEQGKHQSDKDKYDRQLVSQRQMIQEAAEKHEIRGYDGDLDDQEINAFYERIQKMLQDTKRNLERLQRDNAAELDAKSAVITELESRKASRIRDRKTSSQRVATLQRDITKLQGDLNNLDVDEGAEAVLRTEMKGLESRIKQAKADNKVAELDSQIKELNNEVLTLEAQGAKLSRELVECTNLAAERAQLELRKNQLKERKGELDILKSTFNQQLTEVIGKDWISETIETDFQKALRRLSDRLSELRKTKDSTQQELKQVEFKLTTAREKQTKSVKERDSCKKDVYGAVEKAATKEMLARGVSVDDYAETVAEIEKELKIIDTDMELDEYLTEYFTSAKEAAEEKKTCYLCDQSLANEKVMQKLMKKIRKKLDDKHKDEQLKEQAMFRRLLGTLRSVRTKYETYGRLCKELPGLVEEINTLTSEKERLVRQLEDQDGTFKAAEEKRNAADGLSKSVLKIAQAVKDIADFERQVERSQQNSSIQVRSADEINDDQTACAEQLRITQAKLTKLTAERQRLKDQAAQLEVEKLELKHKITEVVQQLEHKKRLQDTIKNHKEEQNELRKNMQDIDKEVESIDPEIASARAALEESRKQGRAREQRIAEERDGIATTVSELKMINREIQDYLDRGGPANLASNQRAIASLENTIATLERDMKELTTQIHKLNKEIDNSDTKRRNIADNLTYRKNLRERDALEEEIEELVSRNAQEDYDRLVKEAHYLESRRGKLNADRDRLMGSMSTKDEQFARLNDEYEIELKGARARFKESHIKVETTKAAIEDLARGMVALDQAIMQYHSLKMEEINRTIGELWQSTYQGTDIDTIQIRSDMDSSASGGASGNTRRIYNYRVSMIKGDTEMDMRGRCSAGQKVLACIIIRLALAESFGLNCGLIALDEPTTNLDSDNIRSLAESLHAIIKARKSQNNLQLVVITHDEEFLKHMQCSEFCDDFFRVKRDENQNSVISRENITRISE